MPAASPTGTLRRRAPEAMADVQGACALPLTGAVVQYRRRHEAERPATRANDVGAALVLEGRFASSVHALDLGSGRERTLDLTSELVVLDWVHEPTLAHVRSLAAPDDPSDAGASDDLRRYGLDLALRVVERRGFGPLTRPVVLRIGFSDLAADFDPFHDGSVRIATGPAAVARARLDEDANSLVFRSDAPAAAFSDALRRAFPGATVVRARRAASGRTRDPGEIRGEADREVRLGVPVAYGEARASLDAMRRGLGALLARFEPERFRASEALVATFGRRATLDRLRLGDAEGDAPAPALAPESSADAPAAARPQRLGMTVH